MRQVLGLLGMYFDAAVFICQKLFTFIWNGSVYTLGTVKYTCFLPGWSGAEIKCNVHVALPKRPINQIKLLLIAK